MTNTTADGLQAKWARRFRLQSEGCHALASPLYGTIFERAADDLDRGGPVWRVTEPYAGDPGGSMVQLRIVAATHRLALAGDAPDLAAHLPSTGGDGDADKAWDAWIGLVEQRPDAVIALAAHGIQTNEVRRCNGLLLGFLTVASATRLPLRLLEVGGSAGLILRWDSYRYHAGDDAWGPQDSPVDFGDPYTGLPRGFLDANAAVTVAERGGCDVSPIDPSSRDGRLWLLSWVWPDQSARFALLDAACAVAARTPVSLDQASASDWTENKLGAASDGRATVVFHSVMQQYLSSEERHHLRDVITAAGARATASAPLAWLRFEPHDPRATEVEVRLSTWPGGDERLLAIAHPHGTWVRWTG